MNPDDIKSLIRHRMANAQEALADAKILIDADRTSTSIVNRSYYAMFYAAHALLHTVGQTPSKHSGVVSLFNREFVLKGIFPRELGRTFSRIFELRQSSDYVLPQPVEKSLAVETWTTAGQFVEAVRAYLTDQGWI